MEHFVVSARKYRPQSFEDVVGQQSITHTLDNAITHNHLAQALLFTGPRGVGKTTCARILAKKINQASQNNVNPDEDFAFNVFELDAASNNSVDDIRNLIDQVRIPPQVGKYKVYIIDEVHMLSASAFNAFLKTLEEPPAHAIFILATTEKHKIIPTILSRCQIFDFKRITVRDMKEYLHLIAKRENITAEDDALHIIAQKADGALRDALSIFDRIVSFSGSNLTRQAVTENLNVLDYDTYFETTDLLLKNDIPAVLVLFNDVINKGFDAHHFIIGLASHFRDVLVAKDKQTIPLLEVGDVAQKKYLLQSEKTTVAFLLEAIDIANTCDLNYKSSKNQRLLIELALMQMASITQNTSEKKKLKFIISPSFFQQTVVSKSDEALVNHIETYTIPKESVEKPKIEKLYVDSTSRRNSALSITGGLKKPDNTVVIEQKTDNLSVTPFTQAEFTVFWKKYIEILNKQGEKMLAAIISATHFEIIENQIKLTFPNTMMLEEVRKNQVGILNYMKKNLNNYSIGFDYILNEAEEKNFIYTPQEKYQKLVEINPIMVELKKVFDLDV